MALPNPAMDFTPFDPLTAAEMDDLVENIEALQDGSAFDADSLDANILQDGSVDEGKLNRSSFQQSSVVVTSSSGSTSSSGTVVMTGNYDFISGRRYLIIVGFSLLTTNADNIVWRATPRVGTTNLHAGTRFEGGNQQYGGERSYLYTASSTATLAVNTQFNQDAGSGTGQYENGFMIVIPLPN